jgi:hypothetical protein
MYSADTTGARAMNTEMHPWLSTPEAAEAARKAVQIPLALLPELASRVGADKLETQALAILTECALPPRDQAPTECAKCGTSLGGVRKGSRFCGPDCRREYAANMPEASKSHPRGATRSTAQVQPAYVGSMHSWPEDDRQRYAAREIGYALMNWLRTNPQ